MNKTMKTALAAGLAFIATAGAQAAGRLYIGGGVFPIQITGAEDVHLSDWETWGTGSAEGRLALPLGKANSQGLAGGFTLGGAGSLGGPLDFILELQGGFSGGSVVAINLGLEFAPVRTPIFSLGLTGKLGYGFGSVSLGGAEALPGKYPTLVLKTGETINSGDSISAEFGAFVVQGGLRGQLMLTPNFGLGVDVAYIHGFTGSFRIKIGKEGDDKDVTLKMSDPAVVKPEMGSTTQAGVNPQAEIRGLVAMLSLVWAIF